MRCKYDDCTKPDDGLTHTLMWGHLYLCAEHRELVNYYERPQTWKGVPTDWVAYLVQHKDPSKNEFRYVVRPK